MLLALWADFWNPASWVSGGSAAPVVVVDLGSGGGNYEPAHWDYWEAREAMLARYSHKEVEHIPVSEYHKPEAEKIVKKINKVVQLAKKPPKLLDLAVLGRMDKLLSDLAGQLDKLVLDSDEEALLALLL